MEKYLVVIDLVADIRRKPSDAEGDYVFDDLRETQALYNEVLLCRDQIEEWYYVEAVEQKKYGQNNALQGYPGWIRKRSVAFASRPVSPNVTIKSHSTVIRKEPSPESEILCIAPIGTRFSAEEFTHDGFCRILLFDGQAGWINSNYLTRCDACPSEKELREDIVSTAKLFIGTPYLWGGRSVSLSESRFKIQGSRFNVNSQLTTRNSQLIAGVDCSGLTNLIFRIHNVDIPRDAHDQWMAAEKISPDQLKPGDLIFISAGGNDDRIFHVMLYIGNESFIEALETGSFVQTGTLRGKFGSGMSELSSHDFRVGDRRICFGRALRMS